MPEEWPSDMPLDEAALAHAILAQYRLPALGVHGVSHWARVLENGLRIAERNGAVARVVTLFALFHDACRDNESRDHGHGARGAVLALRTLSAFVSLEPAELDLLADACIRHTDGLTTNEPTLQACWDADRLDLPRVGIRTNPLMLSSAAARELISWAAPRAAQRVVPGLVADVWGLEPHIDGIYRP